MLLKVDNNFDILSLKKFDRIVSLVPSLTETIADLKGAEQLVGVTRFCKYPPDVCIEKTNIGGTKTVKFNKINKLNPDIILAVKEENNRKEIIALSENYKVLLFDILSLKDVITMIKVLGRIVDNYGGAEQIIKKLTRKFSYLHTATLNSAIYLIWKNPWMAAGKKSFINEMMRYAGFENIIQGRYPEVENKDFKNAEFILLSSEPFPFNEKHQNELRSLYPDKKVIIVDGEMFSWYGTHLLKAPDYFKSIKKG